MPRKPGASAILMYEGRILFILRDDKPTIPSQNTWNAPGGGIEEEETADEAVRRELQEEVSVSPEHLQEAGVTTYDDGSVVYRFFGVLSKEEYEKVKLGDEGQCLDWFTYEEALLLDLSPHFRPYFEGEEENIKKLLERSLP